MRTFITTIKQKISLSSTSLVTSILLVLVAIPAAVLAYGPERATFTIEHPASYVTFDSITNDPTYGDERNFFRVRDVASGEHYRDQESLVPGKTYEAQIFYHNNASSDLNASGAGIAHNAYARAEMPAIIKAGSTGEANAYVGASNANPQTVYDYIDLTNSTQGDIALRYIPGTAKIFNNGATNGASLGDSALFGGTGTPLGFDSLNGTLPACDHYSGYITYQFTAIQPNFTFAKNVRLDGTKNWQANMTVNQGAVVNYELAYDNTGNAQQDDVVLRDKLPAGVTFIPGSVKLYNANFTGKTEDDSIASSGINIGNYTAGSNAFLVFSARIDAAPCTVLTNTANVETDNGGGQASSTVTVAGNCASTLPTTGPAQVVAGLIGIGAITLGVVYYFKSRRDLEHTLLHVQSHPSHTLSTNNLTSDPDASVVADVDSEKTKHKKSEHKK